MAYVVYILECVNGSYYVGYTTDIKRRYQEHLEGSPKCKYTRSFPPKKIAATWEFDNLSEAMSVEKKIKMLSRKEKVCLVENPDCMNGF